MDMEYLRLILWFASGIGAIIITVNYYISERRKISQINKLSDMLHMTPTELKRILRRSPLNIDTIFYFAARYGKLPSEKEAKEIKDMGLPLYIETKGKSLK